MDARSPGRPVGDRRSGADRRSPDRLDQETRRTPGDRRQLPRHQVPFGAWAVTGVLRGQAGQRWPATLWDISRRGACLVVIGELSLQPGDSALLTLHDTMQVDSLELEVKVCWQFYQGHETFLGVLLNGGADIPEHCFLAPYLEETWAEGEPTHDGLV
ncbi:PilZ domain-containing protein [Vulcanococcus limneticus]|uniref:PilZ domain-containing protein n=1 Tax=Vulcanococcus limneticus TaxID=2170428 RepID=UPI00398BC70A